VGQKGTDVAKLVHVWQGLMDKFAHLRAREPLYDRISATTDAIGKAGAPHWAARLRTEPATDDGDPAAPADWRDAWNWASRMAYLKKIGATEQLARLHGERLHTEKALRDGFASVVKE